MRFRRILAVGSIIAVLSLSGCMKNTRHDSITIIGSDTMVNLIMAWAESYMKINPAIYLAITGGGSGTGIASLINKTCDIAACSRQLKPKELSSAQQNQVNPLEHIVALDGIAVVVHPQTPLIN